MPNQSKFPSHLSLSLCSALHPLLPCAALPQMGDRNGDQSSPTRTVGHDHIGMVNPGLNPANGPVGFRLGMRGVV
jgi:hypothetical protein